jgi:SAM-dependent methyltransferase
VNTAKRHYEALLGSIYRWSVSAAGDPVARAAAWLARYELDRAETYLDLGAGFGAHTLALARAGKRVTAVDFDSGLLDELRGALGEHAERVSVKEAELCEFVRTSEDGWDVILCAGDTLTHLPARSDVAELIAGCRDRLTPAGKLALAYRDSTDFAAEGSARFLEVARDETRSMHCLLEPLDEEHLRVTDIVTDVGPDGPRTRISDYVKLRLAPALVEDYAARAGLRLLVSDEERGMTTQIFARA